MIHPEEHQLQDFVDKMLDENHERAVSQHLLLCNQCARKVRRLQIVDNVIRRSLLEKAPPEISGNVLNRLGIVEAPPFAWKILKNLAPVVGLIMVGMIVFVVFKVTGKFNEPGIQSSLQAGQSIYTKVGENLSSGFSVFNSWMRTYVRFAFAGKSGGLTAFIVLFLAAIAILDKFVFAPMLKRGKRA
jgi:hypothetical protein